MLASSSPHETKLYRNCQIPKPHYRELCHRRSNSKKILGREFSGKGSPQYSSIPIIPHTIRILLIDIQDVVPWNNFANHFSLLLEILPEQYRRFPLTELMAKSPELFQGTTI